MHHHGDLQCAQAEPSGWPPRRAARVMELHSCGDILQSFGAPVPLTASHFRKISIVRAILAAQGQKYNKQVTNTKKIDLKAVTKKKENLTVYLVR